MLDARPYIEALSADLRVCRQMKLANGGSLIPRTCTHTFPPFFLGRLCVCVSVYVYFRLVCLFFHRNLDSKDVGNASRFEEYWGCM